MINKPHIVDRSIILFALVCNPQKVLENKIPNYVAKPSRYRALGWITYKQAAFAGLVFNIFLAACLLISIPTTAFAGLLSLPLGAVEISSQGETTVERVGEDQIEIVTQGLQTTGIVDCKDDEQCLTTGLDGETLVIDQNLSFRVDETTMAITGEATGYIHSIADNTSHQFTGTISGVASCKGQQCQSLWLDVQVGVLVADIGEDCWLDVDMVLATTIVTENDQSSIGSPWKMGDGNQ